MMMTHKLPSFVILQKSNFIFEFVGYGTINSSSLSGNMTKGKKNTSIAIQLLLHSCRA